MTQDVYTTPNAFDRILSFILSDNNMLVAYGRQVDNSNNSTIFEKKARQFNYPKESIVKSKNDKERLGIKTVFSSDAFSIYRRKQLIEIGSFPESVLYCEDEYVAAKAITNGYNVGYCAESMVYHSNHLNLKQQYERYKSIGKFHRQNPWIQTEFGRNESEGIKSVFSEWHFLMDNKKTYLIPYSVILAAIKYMAYKF